MFKIYKVVKKRQSIKYINGILPKKIIDKEQPKTKTTQTRGYIRIRRDEATVNNSARDKKCCSPTFAAQFAPFICLQ